MKIPKFIHALFALAIMAVALTPIQQAAASPSDAPVLTTVGKQAFADVTTCLTPAQGKALDVFYLIDTSGSLTYTDKNEMRRDVVASSVKSLGSFLDQGINVSWASALFSTSVVPKTPWATIKSASDADSASSRVASFVNNKSANGFTDWEGGLRYAQSQLDSKPATDCKLLIWFTDGGVNPNGTVPAAVKSLANLCNSSITAKTLGDSAGKFGLMQTLREHKISVFGVLLQNDESSLEHYRSDSTIKDPAAQLQNDHYLMSYMQALVEGSGAIEQNPGLPGFPAGGNLKCANVDTESHLSLGGVPNGAFLKAQNPLDLAYQFASLQCQVAGCVPGTIEDGKFNVADGTAKIRLITTAEKWHLAGPGGSKVDANQSSRVQGLLVSQVSGVTQIDYAPGNKNVPAGVWQFDSGNSAASVFFNSGLTLNLDRSNNSQVLGGAPNSLTGAAIRIPEFSNLKVNLAVYPSRNLTVSTLNPSSGKYETNSNVTAKVTDAGEISISGYDPGVGLKNATVLLSLDLGSTFGSISSKFDFTVLPFSSVPHAINNPVQLSTLNGPKGAATGTLQIAGPSTGAAAQYCIDAAPSRLSDAQTGVEQVKRESVWKFTFGNGSNCIQVPAGKTLSVPVKVTNPEQADSQVSAIFKSNATAGSSTYGENLGLSFQSTKQTNVLVASLVIFLLMLLGLLIPLAALYVFNRATTKFLPLVGVQRGVFPVQINNGRLSDNRATNTGGQIQVGPNDMAFIPPVEKPQAVVPTGYGDAKARVPLFPLITTWFEWQAPTGSRLITPGKHLTKSTAKFSDGRAGQVSPNFAENWAIQIPEGEFNKPAGEALFGTLVLYSAMGQLSAYQSKIAEISSESSIGRRVTEIRAAIQKEQEAAASKGAKASKAKPTAADSSGAAAPQVQAVPGVAPSIPGVGPAIPGVTSPVPGVAPSIPGVTAPIPGVSAPIPGVTPPIPGVNAPIPGVNPPIPGTGNQPGSTSNPPGFRPPGV